MPKGVKYWNKEKDDKVRYTYFHNLCHAELAAELGVTKSAISSRGYVLGLSRPRSEAQKIVCQTDWRKQQLKDLWPKRRKNKLEGKTP